ncbi:hypothetical protein LTS10_007752 [Elasticomyces elasticus]|nr:hypothetical protein LTS10_007752 [Elasticomyces elasticus]
MDEIALINAVSDLAKKHSNSNEPPPFSDAEIIAIVLLLREDDSRYPIPLSDIVARVPKTFNHFAQLSAQDSSRQEQILIRRFGGAVRLFHLPVMDHHRNAEWCWRLFPFEGYKFLRLHLPPTLGPVPYSPTAPSHFNDLPSEISILIWEHVLRYPDSGLRMVNRSYTDQDHGISRKVTFCQRAMKRQIKARAWGRHIKNQQNNSRARLVHAGSRMDVVAPLLVNKKSFSEAETIFYKINIFVCLSIDELEDFLDNLDGSRHQYLRHVSFVYRGHVERAPQVFARLMTTGVKEVTISVNEKALLAVMVDETGQEYAGPRDLPGMNALAGHARLAKVRLDGDCGRMMEMFANGALRRKVVRVPAD